MPETKTGGCHCGQIRYDVSADLSQIVACNCSICTKRGALWTFVPRDKFSLRAGEDLLRDYQFGKKSLHHLFCANCGVASFSRGTGKEGQQIVAVNVRCLDGVNIGELMLTPFDGKSI
jgi:hypothetical protein